MSIVLGMDIGGNSIGWAIIDTSANKALQCGVVLLPSPPSLSSVGSLIKRICRKLGIIPHRIAIEYHLPRAFKNASLSKQRSLKRCFRRVKQRFVYRLTHWLQFHATELLNSTTLLDKVKKLTPVLLHSLLASLFIGSLLMAILHQKDFQFWFNLAITILLAWIATKK